MGNRPARNKIQQPYNVMVEDAISALKDRPGSTQADVFNYLETKYEGKIPLRAKKNLETVIRSVLKTKKRGRPGRPVGRNTGRKVRFQAKSSGLGRSKPGRLSSRGKNARRLIPPRPGKDSKKSKLPRKMRTLKAGKKLHMPRAKSGGHRLLKKVRGGISRNRATLHRHMNSHPRVVSMTAAKGTKNLDMTVDTIEKQHDHLHNRSHMSS